MSVSALELGRGFVTGRIASSTAPNGSYVFQLGSSSKPIEYLSDGDRIEVSQDAAFDFSTEKLVRCAVELEAPVVMSAGAYWMFEALLGGTVFYSRRIEADGRALSIDNIGLSTRGAPAPPATTTVTFRITLTIP